jgi:hypothetical protein
MTAAKEKGNPSLHRTYWKPHAESRNATGFKPYDLGTKKVKNLFFFDFF